MSPGDICFVMHNDSWISKAIAWFAGSRWSHTLLIKEVTTTEIYTIETNDYCSAIGYLDFYLKDPNVTMEVWTIDDMDYDDRKAAVRGALRTYGLVYGYAQLFSFAIRALLSRLGIRIRNFCRWGVVCSEVVMYGLSETRIPQFHQDPELVNQQDLYNLVTHCPSARLVYSKKSV